MYCYSAPVEVAGYCDERVYLVWSLCEIVGLYTSISQKPHVQTSPSWHLNVLFTFGFMDDVMVLFLTKLARCQWDTMAAVSLQCVYGLYTPPVS